MCLIKLSKNIYLKNGFISVKINIRNRFSKEKMKYYNFVNKLEHNLNKQISKIINDKLEYLKSGAISNINKGGNCTINKNKFQNKNVEVKNFYLPKNGIKLF